MFRRLRAPWGRDVLYAGGNPGGPTPQEFTGFVLEKDWPVFAAKQIELLVKEGIAKETAEAYYAPTLEKKPHRNAVYNSSFELLETGGTGSAVFDFQ